MAEAPLVQEIRMSVDEVGKRVIFQRWGEMRGASGELLVVLTVPFREARQAELSPEQYSIPVTAKSRTSAQVSLLMKCYAAGCFGVEMQSRSLSRKPATLHRQSMPLSRAANGTAIGLIQIE